MSYIKVLRANDGSYKTLGKSIV